MGYFSHEDEPHHESKRGRLSPHLSDPNNENELHFSQPLLSLPVEILELVAQSLSSRSLLDLRMTCRYLSSIAVKVAKRTCMKFAHGNEAIAARWRSANWLERLYIEESAANFDISQCEANGFQFINGHEYHSSRRPEAQASESVSMGSLEEPDASLDDDRSPLVGQVLSGIQLEGIGPKLLVSELSTADRSLLRWRLELRGNNAVEFGCCPASLQDQPKALHKCFESESGVRPSGFCSAITVGSLLPVKLPLMRGSVVEILLCRSRLSFLVTNPSSGTEMTWHNAVTVPKLYKGPREFRFEQDLEFGDEPMKLAITCWARAQFEVLHHHPPYVPHMNIIGLEQDLQRPHQADADLAGLGALGELEAL